MNSNAGNGKNRSRMSTRKRKDDECAKCGCSYDSDLAKDAEDLKKKLEEIHRLRKYLDFFEAMLTEMKKLNGDMQVSESDPLSIVDHLKGLLCDMDKVARSGLPATDSSALYRKLCELPEKFSQLDNMVNRVESVFSGKTVRNLTKLLDDCEKNMLGFQVGLKEFQYIGAMEREILELMTINEELFQMNEKVLQLNETQSKQYNRRMEYYDKYLEKFERDMKDHNKFMEQYNRDMKDHNKFMEKYDSVCKRLHSTEDLVIELTKKRGLGKRRNSW